MSSSSSSQWNPSLVETAAMSLGVYLRLGTPATLVAAKPESDEKLSVFPPPGLQLPLGSVGHFTVALLLH